jgi:hypothetical protein
LYESHLEGPASPDDAFQHHGCAIFIIAAILLAVERLFLFYALASPAIATVPFASMHDFMFGSAPYSIFDVLLGFEVPSEGLFFILQPRNLALGAFQAVHFGINLAVAHGPFLAYSKLKGSGGRLKVITGLGCAAALILVLCITSAMVYFALPRQSPASNVTVESEEPNRRFSSREFGMAFEYPSYMTIAAESLRDRGPSGEIITLVDISATSADPFLGILVRTIEDPLRDQMFPALYPPDGGSLRLLLIGDLTDLALADTDENSVAIRDASENATFRQIAGYRAATYIAKLTSREFGAMYVRGAFLVTDRRDVT